MLSASLWMILATGFFNLSMAMFHRQMSESLKEGYAQLSALIGLVNVLGVLTTGLSTYYVKVFSRDAALAGSGAVKTRLVRLGQRGLWVLPAAALLMLPGPWVVAYLKLPSLWLYAAVIGLIGSGLALALLRGAIQGLHRFRGLAGSQIAEAVGRVGGALGLVALGWGVGGALLGSLGGCVVGMAGCLFSLTGMGPAGRTPKAQPGKEAFAAKAAELGRDTLALGLFSLLCYLDIFVYKHYHTEGDAATYSRAALVAKSFLYAPSAFTMVLLPMVAAARSKGGDTRGILLKFLAAMAGLELAGLAFVWAFAPFTIRLLCGSSVDAEGLAPLVRWFCVAIIPLALFQLILLREIAHHSGGVLAFEAVVAAGYTLLLEFFHASPWQMVGCLGAASLAALAGGLVMSMRRPEMSTLGQA